jgi:chromosome segregation ATPase
VDEFAATVGEGADAESRLYDALSAVIAQRVTELQAEDAQLRGRLDETREAVAGLTGELAERRDPADVERELAERISAGEALLHDLASRLETIPSLDERLGALDGRVAAASGRFGDDLDSLRRELDAVRAALAEKSRADGEHIEIVAGELRAELHSAAEGHAARMDGFGAELATRFGDLDALRGRLERAEAALGEAAAWPDAVGAAHSRIDSLEATVVEASAAEADERDSQVGAVRAELGRIESQLAEHASHEEALGRATEAAVREGIASLGERLTASGEAYLETGKELSRSLAGLGLALTAAETLGDEPRSTDRPPADVSVFLAFAPTTEGYRLVECAGSPPELDDELEVDGCDGALVVTRTGASPLPFDTRRCVYLERL